MQGKRTTKKPLNRYYTSTSPHNWDLNMSKATNQQHTQWSAVFGDLGFVQQDFAKFDTKAYIKELWFQGCAHTGK